MMLHWIRMMREICFSFYCFYNDIQRIRYVWVCVCVCVCHWMNVNYWFLLGFFEKKFVWKFYDNDNVVIPLLKLFFNYYFFICKNHCDCHLHILFIYSLIIVWKIENLYTVFQLQTLTHTHTHAQYKQTNEKNKLEFMEHTHNSLY